MEDSRNKISANHVPKPNKMFVIYQTSNKQRFERSVILLLSFHHIIHHGD